jgi:di/tricarboxylate transporter
MYVCVLMITYWVTEALPLAVSSMLPILLFPIFDIMVSSKPSSITIIPKGGAVKFQSVFSIIPNSKY